VTALDDFFDPHRLRAGDRIRIQLDRATLAGRHRLRSLRLETARHEDLTLVARSDGVFALPRSSPPPDDDWALAVRRRSGSVAGDFRAALVDAALPAPVIDEVIVAFRDDPDLPAHPEPGSRFTVVYEVLEGAGVGTGTPHLCYTELRSDGAEHRVYRYPVKGGEVAFVGADGRGIVPLRLGPPVGHARITSPWGWRIHPVLHVRKFHRGVDFGARTGTPVRAAADGRIETIGWRGNYGRYIRLRHSVRVETGYAHLSRFAKGLQPGSPVRRGQVIAYVGASGLATGPHLYYEVMIDHRRVDPQRQGLAVPIQLAGPNLTHFFDYLAEVDSAVASR
jgi:murein DD-endopeptidase MepM/ murein hydrolase activator NlpD